MSLGTVRILGEVGLSDMRGFVFHLGVCRVMYKELLYHPIRMIRGLTDQDSVVKVELLKGIKDTCSPGLVLRSFILLEVCYSDRCFGIRIPLDKGCRIYCL